MILPPPVSAHVSIPRTAQVPTPLTAAETEHLELRLRLTEAVDARKRLIAATRRLEGEILTVRPHAAHERRR